MKYRKRPITIEAFKTKDLIEMANNNWKALPEFIIESYERGDIVFTSSAIHIRTLEGTMEACLDDFIIRGIKGEFYPCKPDIFKESYEEVEI